MILSIAVPPKGGNDEQNDDALHVSVDSWTRVLTFNHLPKKTKYHEGSVYALRKKLAKTR